MAHLITSRDNSISGLEQPHGSPTFDHEAATSEASKAPSLPYVSPQPPASFLKRRFASEETVPGLLCSYGTFAYSFAKTPPGDHSTAHQFAKRGCHNPVQTPRERYHCDDCGGDYCKAHSVPAAHDCESIVHSQR